MSNNDFGGDELADKLLSIHPSHDVLRGFVVGKLNDADAARVETHLAECASCNRVLADQPENDAFVDLVRSIDADHDGWPVEPAA